MLYILSFLNILLFYNRIYLKEKKNSSTVAPSGPQAVSRRKPSSSSEPPSSSSPGFFGLALFLFLTLDFDQGSPSTASAASSSQNVEITYGTILKLMHEKTKFRLHSHDVPYGSGSGQQSVTSFPNVDDSNSYWIVRPMPDTSTKQGETIPSGTIIRLQHMRTRKWLHSHLHASPISGNLEVSCFGGESESDTGDYWRLIIEGSGKTWKQDQRIRLQHVDTGGYLHSHDKKYARIAGGQQEVCGVREKRADNVWLAAEEGGRSSCTFPEHSPEVLIPSF
ncbi:Stromal cell-derived factor 2-like protein precursor isoform 1 [Theobroma cacao]|uniref:Stromal cell-derived factor 2-like protein isoform 1 n=1 Tax=Theobroma cacao TaxID=3641 RepID=A0A061GIW6_THECC|nr:Stromal cell-derived factor 2-like protein precursor isoform 1 [Theobroma cacao]